MTHLIRYLHINPVIAKLVVKPEHWQFSNYSEWIGRRKDSLFSKEIFNNLFNSYKHYQEFVEEYVKDQRIMKGIEKYLFD